MNWLKNPQNRALTLGYLFAVGSTAIWAGNFVIARGINQSVSPVSLAFARWLVAVLVFAPFTWRHLRAEWQVIRANLGYLAICGILGVTMFNTLIYTAAHTTDTLNISLISITFPVFIVLFSALFLGERVNMHQGIGMLLIAAGVLVLVTKGALYRLLEMTFAIGDVWVLLASIVFAIYSILVKHKPKGLSLWAFQLSTFGLGLLFLFPLFLWEQFNGAYFAVEGNTLLAVLYIGIFASLLAFIFWNRAVTVIGPAKAGMVYYTLPIFSGILAFFTLGEKMTAVHAYSILLILGGIILSNRD